MKKYALVEWTNEADAGSYSVVDSEWILGYTPEMYLIEWREGQGKKKPPTGGWPMGEAKILQTSDKESELKKALHDMTSKKNPSELVVSGKRRRIPKKRLYESDDETDTDVGGSSGNEKKRMRGAKKAEESDVSSSSPSQRKAGQKRAPNEDQTQTDKEQEPEVDQEERDLEAFHDTSSDREIEDSTDGMGTDGCPHGDEMENGDEEEEEEEEERSEGEEYPPEYELSELEKLRLEVRGLRDEIMLLRHQVCKELPKVHAIALKALGTHNNVRYSMDDEDRKTDQRKTLSRPVAKGAVGKGRRRPVEIKKTGVLKKEAEIVEIHPGSGVFVDREAWDSLNELDQPTAFARRLLPFVFSMETLLNSNLRGGKSTRDSAAEPKNPLDPKRVDAIYNAVYCKFPRVRHCDIGQAINGRLSNLRYQAMKKTWAPSFPSQLPTSLILRHNASCFQGEST
ncbi:ATP-dependent RNA helicase DRS1 isoform X4 [Strongylocentrotus purpuratus]|uniref:BEN domain-containing protein n=1 Tax=Strongylocentrotus purpuratus TaxID=7668 RepID=A0A7M7HNM4_STRPU|nr:ATP-dependent RNA helicase DRS1 isoform X4 [Strongylocentrotus purpuratus]